MKSFKLGDPNPLASRSIREDLVIGGDLGNRPALAGDRLVLHVPVDARNPAPLDVLHDEVVVLFVNQADVAGPDAVASLDELDLLPNDPARVSHPLDVGEAAILLQYVGR